MRVVRCAFVSCNAEINEDKIPDGIIDNPERLKQWLYDNVGEFDYGPLTPIDIEIEEE